MIYELQKKITELKKEKDFCILAHSYQGKEITEIADFVGDSFQLSRMATGVSNKNILMCVFKRHLCREHAAYGGYPQ